MTGSPTPEPRASRDLPNAQDEFESVTAAVGSHPAVFSDYDGTLTEIVEDPADALLPEATRSVLAALAACCPVGIISGRRLADIEQLVGIAGLMYVGSHGLEMKGPDGGTHQPEAVHDTLGILRRVEPKLTEDVSLLPGIVLERKRFSIAVHTRRAENEEARRQAREAAAEAVAGSDSLLRLQYGKEVAELRPAIDWDKGSAVSYLLDQLPETSAVLYLGDDRTDEAGFRQVRSSGGISIVVGASMSTRAHYRLDGPEAVTDFLARLADHAC